MTTEAGIITRSVADADKAEIHRLHALVFGPGRFARSAYRVREGAPFHSRYCRAALLGSRIVAALRLTPITVGGTAGALLLGPLAVDPAFANQGWGRRLVAESCANATRDGFRVVLLVGNLSYYSRMSFASVPPGQIWLPGPADPARILARELVAGSLPAFCGLIAADLSNPDRAIIAAPGQDSR